MAIKNPWVGYLNRSYDQIKQAVINKLPANVPEVTDHSEGNLLIKIVGIFAGIAEMLNHYIDNVARESFITTARKFSSVVKLTRLIDYRIKAAIPSSTDLTLYFKDGANPFILTSDYTVNVGSIFTDEDGREWVSTKTVTAPAGLSEMVIPVRQYQFQAGVNIGTTDGTANQEILIGTDYVDDTMTLLIGTQFWERKNTLGRSKPTDQHFIIEITTEKNAVVKFGDGVNGAIPVTGQAVFGDYFITNGLEGNNAQLGSINTITTALVPPTGATLEVTNLNLPSGGLDYESLESIKRSAPLSIRTLDRAVTRQDYVDIAILSPGVELAALQFDCGKTVDIYIAPENGGLAQGPLLSSTLDYINQRKMVTTFVNVLPAGETYVKLTLDITGKFRIDAASIQADVTEAILENYQFSNSDINKKLRTSDIISLVDNLDKVDFLDLTKLSAVPYPRPLSGSVALNWDIEVLNTSTTTHQWTLQYTGTNFIIRKDGTYITNVTVGTQYTDPDGNITFTINSGAYVIGMNWEFKTYPNNKNLEIDDFTVPIIREQDLILNITEQLVNAN